MSLKFVIDSLTGLDESLHSLYEEKDGKFFLKIDVTQHPDFKSVLSNKNEILDEKKQIQARLKEIEDASHSNKVVDHEKANEFKQALELERKQFEDYKASIEAEKNGLKDQLRTVLLDNRVQVMAADLAGDNAELIKPHIMSRLTIDEKDGKMELFVKDAAGNPSTTTIEQLQEELSKSETYLPILKGRDSSGAGSTNDGGGSGNASENEKYFDPTAPEYSIEKQTELEVSNKTLHDQLADKFDPLKAVGLG